MTRKIASLVAAAVLPWAGAVHAQDAAAKPAADPAAPPATAPATPATAPSAVPVAVPAAPPVEEKMGRELAGHLFLPSHLLEDPFSYTAFGISLGLGSGNALGETINPNPPPLLGPPDKWYGYSGLGLNVVLNVRILEYLSARATLGTTAYLGTGNGAAITVGTSARITGDLGVKGSLPVGEHFRFSAAVDAAYGPVYGVLIGDGLKSIIDACRSPTGCTVDPDQFLQQADTITWTTGLTGAWAPLPYLGVTLNAQLIFPTKTDKGAPSVSQNGYTLAAQIDFDARPLLPWLPIGVNGAISITSPLGSNGVTTTKDYGFGIYYTGRPHLALGVELTWRDGRLESQQVSNALLAWLNLRYYWN